MKFMTKLSSPHRVRKVGALLLALGLAGCGGDEGGSGGDNSPLPPSPATQVQVVDGFSVARPNERTSLDLSVFVRGSGVILTSLTSEQPECGAGRVSGLTAEVDINDTTLCRYRFSARSGNSEGVATLSVLSTLAATPVLEPLSAAMTLSEASRTFDVVDMYGGSLSTGYNLKANSVVVQGGTLQGSVTQSANSITYTHLGTSDWNRIQFTLEDTNRPGEDILGTLYVTVSESANQAPTISNVKYHYSDPANTNPAILTFQNVTVDLAALSSHNLTIEDPESKEWQLIEVQSYSASVQSAEPSGPNAVTNKKFIFMAGSVGEHIVSYIVGDHEGGYRMGQMSITVGPKENAKSWASIKLDVLYLAPSLYSELNNIDIISEAYWDNGVSNTVAAVKPSVTSFACAGARLPTLLDMKKLYLDRKDSPDLATWPKQKRYLTKDGDSYSTFDLSNGSNATLAMPNKGTYYVTCVGDFKIVFILGNPATADNSYFNVGEVTSRGQVSVSVDSVSGSGITVSDVGVYLTQSDDGRTLVMMRSTKEGSVVLKFTNIAAGSELLSNPIIVKPVGQPPVASNVQIVAVDPGDYVSSGTYAGRWKLVVGSELEATWSYTDADNDPEGDTIVEWYIDGSIAGYGKRIKLKRRDITPLFKNVALIEVNVKPVSQTGSSNSSVYASSFIVTTGISDFYRVATGKTYDEASAYCSSFGPSSKLPLSADLFRDIHNMTSPNYYEDPPIYVTESCDVWGWPMYQKCGGGSDNDINTYADRYWERSDDSSSVTHVNVTDIYGKSGHRVAKTDKYNVACVDTNGKPNP